MIKIDQLIKTYRTEELETTALNNINLEVKKGEFVSIMGPSGCGKSTLMNCIGLLDSFDSGSYQFNDKEIYNITEKSRSEIRKANIGFVFQNFNLIDDLTVYENIELPLIYNKQNKSDRKARVNELLEGMNLAHRARHFPQQLSGGQQQRVAVARALVTKPDLILADEPTGNLDSENGIEVMELLTRLNQEGATIIMVTHSSSDAKFSTRIIELMDGKIISSRQNTPEINIIEVKN